MAGKRSAKRGAGERGGASSAEGRDPLPPLPAGRHGLPREFVVHNQRERLMAALAEVVAEHGYAKATVKQITDAAGVSRRTFYENFANKEECFLATFDVVVDQLRQRVVAAAGEESEWPLRIRAGIAAGLRFLAGEPELAKLCLLEAPAAGAAAEARHREFANSIEPILRAGRNQGEVGEPIPETTEKVLIGGGAALIVRALNLGRGRHLEELLPDLVEFVLTPYVGRRAAERLSRQTS